MMSNRKKNIDGYRWKRKKQSEDKEREVLLKRLRLGEEIYG